MAAIGTIVGVTSAVAAGGAASHEAGKQKEGKLDQTKDNTREDLREVQGDVRDDIRETQEGIEAGRQRAVDAIDEGTDRAAGTLREGEAGARADLQAATGRFGEGVSQARDDIQQGTSQAARPLSDLSSTRAVGTRDVTGQQSRLDQVLAQGPGTVDMNDPAFQARLDAGADVLGKRFAAMGGRSGGRAAKELTRFAQGEASQEFARQRAQNLAEFQARVGAAGGVDQFNQNAAFNQGGRELQAALAAQGLSAQGQQALGQLFAQQGMQNANLSMAGGQFAAGNMNQAAANQLATAQNLANAFATAGQNAANVNMGAAGMNTQAGLAGANLESQIGTNIANSNLIGSDMGGAGLTNLVNYGTAVGEMGAGVVGQVGGAAAGAAASDATVKTNPREAGPEIEAMLDGLEAVSFEYIGQPGRHFGIMAQDAEKSEAGQTMVLNVGGVRFIDLKSAQLMVLAAMANLNKRVRVLEGTVPHGE